jgi:ArsR family transcriptional regulator
MEQAAPQVVAWLATLSDLARLRVLRLLEREELSVGELARVMQLPQSTVSRHLKALLDGGWVRRRVEGTAGYYRLIVEALPEGARELWRFARERLGEVAATGDDDHRLAEVLLERSSDSRWFFGRFAGEWDELRRTLFGSGFTAEALLGLLPAGLVVADLGCGTGNVSQCLAPHVRRVIAIDREPAMLAAARARLGAFANVEFRAGEMDALPLDDGSVDAAVTSLVMHHFEDPVPAVREMARVLRPGGRALIIDMVVHDRESYRYQMGHRHLGFAESELRRWAGAAGLRLAAYHRLHPDTTAKGPGLFAARLERER